MFNWSPSYSMCLLLLLKTSDCHQIQVTEPRNGIFLGSVTWVCNICTKVCTWSFFFFLFHLSSSLKTRGFVELNCTCVARYTTVVQVKTDYVQITNEFLIYIVDFWSSSLYAYKLGAKTACCGTWFHILVVLYLTTLNCICHFQSCSSSP